MPGCCLCTVSPKTWLSLHKPFMTRRQLSPPSRLVHNPLPIVPTQIVQLLDMADSSRSRRRLGSWPWFDESLKLPPPQRQGQGPVILAPWLPRHDRAQSKKPYGANGPAQRVPTIRFTPPRTSRVEAQTQTGRSTGAGATLIGTGAGFVPVLPDCEGSGEPSG